MAGQLSLAFEAATVRVPVYFALRPALVAVPAITECAEWCRRSYGLSEPIYGPHRLHISLNAVTSPRGPRKGDLEAALRAAEHIRFSPFPVAFGRLRTFRVRRDKQPTVLCCCAGMGELTALRDALRQALTREGLWRGPAGFEPHVTLIWDRRSVPPSQLDEPIGWMAEDFVLLRTIVGESRQVEIGRWPFRA
ncbi:MAG: 2'-5' RNA ligase family protein [Rhizobiaceae bacterium]